MTPEQQTALIVLVALFGPKIVTWLTARWISKADDVERKAIDAREEREKIMAQKIDEIGRNVTELRSDAREDRQRQIALSAAHSEVKERINGISENHGKRISALEAEVAALKARRKA